VKPGQLLTRWWQLYVAGGLKTPQDIHAASRAEAPDKVEDRFTKIPQDEAEWNTPARLKAEQFMTSASYAGQQAKADWQQCNANMRLLSARVILRARSLGIPLYVHSAFRTAKEQQALLDRKVTKTLRSAHTIGEAFDLVHGIYQWDLTPREWAFIHWLVTDEQRKLNAKLPKEKRLYINWGGNDGSPSDTFKWDPAHYEVLDYRTRLRSLVAGPPVHMSPSVTVRLFR